MKKATDFVHNFRCCKIFQISCSNYFPDTALLEQKLIFIQLNHLFKTDLDMQQDDGRAEVPEKSHL